jgi:diguanylate cyclase (GGDEF)-like protein
MDANIRKISTTALKNISSQNGDITPSNYMKEYCKAAKEYQFDDKECAYFQKTLAKISKDEIENSNIEKINSIYDLIDLLLQRAPNLNIQKMSEILQTSLQPSISLTIDKDLQSFCIKIGDSPSLIFEDSIQQEMEKFLEKRFEVDKKVVAQKTADIARLISLMNKYLTDAIDSSKNGSDNVTSIKDKIKGIDINNSNKAELNKLQSKLVEAAINIENEMQSVNKNLRTGQEEVEALEKKVQQLEKELKKTKQQNMLDFLTGTLNRRAYEKELHKFENLFVRENQDYAIIFFDIDHFKKLNDAHGHECGDVVLKTFATLLLTLTRDTDIVGRFGGEEFIVALHYHETMELEKYISRIKSVITNNKFIYQDLKLKVTFSAGVQLRSKNQSTEETINNADKLLYKAKETGRDKVIFWNGREL